ncbi:MAG: alkaline phosphatase family protein [Ornithinimicrobium sp.]
MSTPQGWTPPPYAVSLIDVLPAVLSSLSLPVPVGGSAWRTPVITLPRARKAVVALVDGLGARQLSRRSGHAPFLRTLDEPVAELRSEFPSTTATSLASFGTGLRCGEHGLIGTLAPVPGAQRLFSHLSWDGGPDPLTYQPATTLFTQAAAAGAAVTTVSRPSFAGSALTQAALHGGQFVGAGSAQERVDATIAALHAHPGPAVVYLYLDEVDKAGHVYGPSSWQWGEAVETADRTLREVSDRMPVGTSLTVTADHGMIEAPHSHRRDLADDPGLDEGVVMLGGEPRAGHLFCEPGTRAEVLSRWSEILGDEAVVATREEAIDAGWFGTVRADVLPRIGDVVTAMKGPFTVLDSRVSRRNFLALVGHHGSMTDDETLVPLLHRPA